MKQTETLIKNLACVAAVGMLAWLVTGCVMDYGGNVRGQQTSTLVSLSGNNYKLIKPDAKGESTGFSLLLGLIPISRPQFSNAKADMYKSVGEPLNGRAIGFANMTEDWGNRNFILFTIPILTITADVLEFTDKAPGK
jgi:hypothetical protein